MVACFHAVGICEIDRHLLNNNRSFSKVKELRCFNISLDINEGPVAFFEGRSDIVFVNFILVMGDSIKLFRNDFSKFFVSFIMILRIVNLKGKKLGNVKLLEYVTDWMEEYVIYHFEGDGGSCLKECSEDKRCVILR